MANAARSQSGFAYIHAGYSPAPLPQAAITVSVQGYLRQACIVWHTRGIFTPTNRNGTSQCDSCGNAVRAKRRQFCANRVVTTPAAASSDDAHHAPADKD